MGEDAQRKEGPELPAQSLADGCAPPGAESHKCSLELTLRSAEDVPVFIDSISIIKSFGKVGVTSSGNKVQLSFEEPTISRLMKSSYSLLNSSNFILRCITELEALQ